MKLVSRVGLQLPLGGAASLGLDPNKEPLLCPAHKLRKRWAFCRAPVNRGHARGGAQHGGKEHKLKVRH